METLAFLNGSEGMNYLFFDLELANCFNNDKKICSFGYLLCDSSFNIIEYDDILMNPESKWDKYALKNVIKYSIEEFLVEPNFPFFYKKISELFKDTIAIGHSTKFDVQALNDTAKRYDLEKIPLSYLDIAEIFKAYNKDKNIMGLSKLAALFAVEAQGEKHTSLQDARITRDITLKILEMANLSLADLLAKIKMSPIINE